MSKLSIKKVHRLIEDEKPKAIVRYIRKFLPPEKRNSAEVKLDEYAHLLTKNKKLVSKQSVLDEIDYLSSDV